VSRRVCSPSGCLSNVYRVGRSLGHNLPAHLNLMPRSIIHGALPPSPIYASMALLRHRDNLSLCFQYETLFECHLVFSPSLRMRSSKPSSSYTCRGLETVTSFIVPDPLMAVYFNMHSAASWDKEHLWRLRGYRLDPLFNCYYSLFFCHVTVQGFLLTGMYQCSHLMR
jgi:hypothetical protein